MLPTKTLFYQRSGGDLTNIGGSSKYSKDVICPDGCVIFRMTAKKLGNENFYKGKFFDWFNLVFELYS